ncbi:MAG TPA: hypothetical protein VGD17_02280 [Chitinophagaceae bacterium]
MAKDQEKHPRNVRNEGPAKENSASEERTDENDTEFPGYPHYPSKEDIMNPSNHMKRVEVDVENLTPSGKFADVKQSQDKTQTNETSAANEALSLDEDDITATSGTEADLTKDDLLILGGTKYSDNDLQGIARNVVDAEDLDIPGAELDNENEEIGEEDEENNYYSLGGERHEGLEEDPG